MLKRIILVLVILIGLLLIGGLGFLYVLSRTFSDGFAIIPQDCILLKRDISGHVVNNQGMPIKNADIQIQAGISDGFEAGKVNLNLKSDQNGYFSVKGVSVFACDVLAFQISADGYSKKQISFVAAQEVQSGMKDADPDGYGSPQDFTGSSTVQNPVLPREIKFQLP